MRCESSAEMMWILAERSLRRADKYMQSTLKERFELNILDWFQTLHTPVLDKFMTSVTKLGDAGIFWIILTLLFLIIPKMRKTGIVMAAALIIDLLICNVLLKNLVAEQTVRCKHQCAAYWWQSFTIIHSHLDIQRHRLLRLLHYILLVKRSFGNRHWCLPV